MSCQIFTICTFLASFMSFQLVLSRLWPSRLCFSSKRLSSLFPFVSDLQIQLQLFCKLSPFLDCVLFSGLREARFHFYFIQFLLMFFQIESHSRLCFVFWATCFYSTFSFLSQVFLVFFHSIVSSQIMQFNLHLSILCLYTEDGWTVQKEKDYKIQFGSWRILEIEIEVETQGGTKEIRRQRGGVIEYSS